MKNPAESKNTTSVYPTYQDKTKQLSPFGRVFMAAYDVGAAALLSLVAYKAISSVLVEMGNSTVAGNWTNITNL